MTFQEMLNGVFDFNVETGVHRMVSTYDDVWMELLDKAASYYKESTPCIAKPYVFSTEFNRSRDQFVIRIVDFRTGIPNSIAPLQATVYMHNIMLVRTMAEGISAGSDIRAGFFGDVLWLKGGAYKEEYDIPNYFVDAVVPLTGATPSEDIGEPNREVLEELIKLWVSRYGYDPLTLGAGCSETFMHYDGKDYSCLRKIDSTKFEKEHLALKDNENRYLDGKLFFRTTDNKCYYLNTMRKEKVAAERFAAVYNVVNQLGMFENMTYEIGAKSVSQFSDHTPHIGFVLSGK